MGNILAFLKRSPPSLFGLPFDLQCEILSRLPIKSLVQFSCASKQAGELIDDPKFIRAPLKLINTSADSRRVLILWWKNRYSNECRLKQCSLSSSLYAPTTETVEKDLTGVRVVGCCNGLVCIALNETQIILRNPSTRKSKIVPDLHQLGKNDWIFSRGFGYHESKDDPKEDDYKVVLVVYMDGEGVKFKVYSCKDGTWKNIEYFQVGWPPVGDCGKFVNGKLHCQWKEILVDILILLI